MVGGRWEDDDDAPRAVGVDWWDTVCANPNDVQVIYTNTIKHDIGDAPGDQVLDKWARVLREEPKRCVDIRASPEDGYPQVHPPAYFTIVSQFVLMDNCRSLIFGWSAARGLSPSGKGSEPRRSPGCSPRRRSCTPLSCKTSTCSSHTASTLDVVHVRPTTA